jgi:hypothetical protein
LVGQQIIPGDIIQNTNHVNMQATLYTHQVYSKLPKDQTQIVLIVDGNVQSSALTMEIGKMFFTEKIDAIWDEFRTNEPLRPYSINLRYGVNI